MLDRHSSAHGCCCIWLDTVLPACAGEIQVDAHTVLLTTCVFIYMSFPFGLATASTIRVGNLLGSYQPGLAKLSGRPAGALSHMSPGAASRPHDADRSCPPWAAPATLSWVACLPAARHTAPRIGLGRPCLPLQAIDEPACLLLATLGPDTGSRVLLCSCSNLSVQTWCQPPQAGQSCSTLYLVLQLAVANQWYRFTVLTLPAIGLGYPYCCRYIAAVLGTAFTGLACLLLAEGTLDAARYVAAVTGTAFMVCAARSLLGEPLLLPAALPLSQPLPSQGCSACCWLRVPFLPQGTLQPSQALPSWGWPACCWPRCAGALGLPMWTMQRWLPRWQLWPPSLQFTRFLTASTAWPRACLGELSWLHGDIHCVQHGCPHRCLEGCWTAMTGRHQTEGLQWLTSGLKQGSLATPVCAKQSNSVAPQWRAPVHAQCAVQAAARLAQGPASCGLCF